jgi:capsular polysaccharide biosynthesis protein
VSTRTREPELDAEQEVDLGRYARAVATHWWLPVAGIVAGAIVGYLISLGSSQVWKASASVYLGQPYSVIGGIALQDKQTNPSSVGTIVHSEAAIDTAAAAAGMPARQLRGHIATQSVSTGTSAVGTTRIQQTPLVRITVQARTGRKARIAANSLARQVVAGLSGFAQDKIKVLEQRIELDQKQIKAIQGALRASDRTTAAVLAVALGPVQQDQLEARGLVTQAKQVELPSVLTRAAAVRTTAASRRNDVVVAAFLGFVLGLIAALAWEPLAARRRG